MDGCSRRAPDRSPAPSDVDRSKTYRRTPNDYEAEHIPSCEPSGLCPVRPDNAWTASQLNYWASARPLGICTDNNYYQGVRTAEGVDEADPDQRLAAGIRGRPSQRPDTA